MGKMVWSQKLLPIQKGLHCNAVNEMGCGYHPEVFEDEKNTPKDFWQYEGLCYHRKRMCKKNEYETWESKCNNCLYRKSSIENDKLMAERKSAEGKLLEMSGNGKCEHCGSTRDLANYHTCGTCKSVYRFKERI